MNIGNQNWEIMWNIAEADLLKNLGRKMGFQAQRWEQIQLHQIETEVFHFCFLFFFFFACMDGCYIEGCKKKEGNLGDEIKESNDKLAGFIESYLLNI